MQKFVDIPLNVFDGVPQLVEVSDEVLAFAQEIWMCFNMEPNEFIGDVDSGSLTLKQVLFNKSINSRILNELIEFEINTKCSGSDDFRWESDIKFVQGTAGNDIVIIDILIFDDNDRTFRQRFLFK